MIRFKCEECGQRFKVADSFAGKKGKCHKCGMIISLPLSGKSIDDNINASNISKDIPVDNGMFPTKDNAQPEETSSLELDDANDIAPYAIDKNRANGKLSKPDTAKWKKESIAICIIIALCLSALVIFLVKRANNSRTTALSKEKESRKIEEEGAREREKEEERLRTAYEEAKDFVKSQLKSPYSAKFPPFKGRCGQHENQVYIIDSYVDSQNGFGAMVRTDWRISIQRLGLVTWNVLAGNIGTEFFYFDVEERDNDTLDTSLRLKSLIAKRQTLSNEYEKAEEMLSQKVEARDELELTKDKVNMGNVKYLSATIETSTSLISLNTILIKMRTLDRKINACKRRITERMAKTVE